MMYSLENPYLQDIDTLARTLYGEARSGGYPEMLAVAHVVMNRVARGTWGTYIHDVCRAPWQFSCWPVKGHEPAPSSNDERNYQSMLNAGVDDEHFRTAVALAWAASSELLPADPTSGACHYIAQGLADPAWLTRGLAAGGRLTLRTLYHRYYAAIP